jgi:hypothetical protein
MTYRSDFTLPAEILEQIAEHRFEALDLISSPPTSLFSRMLGGEMARMPDMAMSDLVLDRYSICQ